MKTQGGLSVRDYSRASLSKAASLATSHETTGLAWPPVHCAKLGLRPTQLSHKWKATDRPQSSQPGAWTCSGPQILQMKTGRDTSFPNSQPSPATKMQNIWAGRNLGCLPEIIFTPVLEISVFIQSLALSLFSCLCCCRNNCLFSLSSLRFIC